MTGRRRRAVWALAAAGLAVACGAAGLRGAAWLGRGLGSLSGPNPSPVIVRAGSLAAAVEVTGHPFCSPLTAGCPAMPPLHGARYLTAWVAFRAETPGGPRLVSERLIMLRVE